MANFPENPTDGQKIVEEATDGSDRVAIWTYDSLNQQWTYELYEVYSGEKAIYTDQVIVRQPDPENYPELQTQMDVNQLVGSELGLTGEYAIYTDQVKERGTDLTQAQINVTSAASTSAVAQNIDQIQGTKSKGTWQFMGGPVPDDGAPAENQFWMTDKEGMRTQDFCEAVFVRVHALGNQSSSTKDRVVLGVGEVGDKLTIQDLMDRDGGVYTITSVELHEPDGDDYSKAYAVYGVEVDPTYCVGSVSPSEIVTIRLASGEGGVYLPLSGGTANKMQGVLYMGGNKIAGVGNPSLDTDVANKKYVDEIKPPAFIKKYNTSRYFKVGDESTVLTPNDVMFLANGETTTQFAAITHVVLPEIGIDWSEFTHTGTIEVRKGETVYGHLSVISSKHNVYKNWSIKVKVLDILSNDLEIGATHQCYFWGMFFGYGVYTPDE